MASNYRMQLEDWLKNLSVQAGKVLDIGGAANPVNSRVKSWQVKEYLIADNGIEPGHIDIPLDLNIYVDDIINGKKFDIIFCLEVMEYVHDPNMAMLIINQLLRPGGVLYITFPFLYPFHQPIKHDSLRYTKTGVSKLMDNNGFKIEETIARNMTHEGSLAWHSFISIERMHPAKGLPHNELGWIVKAQKL